MLFKLSKYEIIVRFPLKKREKRKFLIWIAKNFRFLSSMNGDFLFQILAGIDIYLYIYGEDLVALGK